MLFSQKYYFHRKSFPKQPFADFYEYVYPACSFPQKKKKRLRHKCFPVYFTKILEKPFYRTTIHSVAFLPSNVTRLNKK